MAAKVTTPAPTVPLPQAAWMNPQRVALPTTSPADWVDPELNAFNAQKGLALASVMGAPVPSLSFGTGTGTAPSLKGLKAAVAPTEAADGSNYDLQGNYVGAGAYDPAGNWTDPYGTGWQGPTPVGQPQWSQASGGME